MTFDTKNPYPREGEGAYIEYTSSAMLLASMFESIGAVNIPSNFQNSAFNGSETPQKAKFMDISLINLTGINEGDKIVLDAGDSFTLDCIIYLALYNNFKLFKIDSTNNDFSISIYDKYDTKIKDILNNEDLKNYNIAHTEFKIKITANSSTIITNIHFEISTKTPDEDSKVKIFLERLEGLDQWKTDLISDVLETEELADINEIPRTAKIGNTFFTKEGTELSLSAQQLLNVLKTVDGVSSGLDSEYLGGQKYDKYASRIQSDTKKFSELANGDYLVGYNHIGSISGEFVTINLGSGDWINLDGYDFSSSETFEGQFMNPQSITSSMTPAEIDTCFTFEVRRNTPQDLSDVKNELISKIGDKLTIETFENGIRIKKNGSYVYSSCWGVVNTTIGTSATTIDFNFPFTFSTLPTILVSAGTTASSSTNHNFSSSTLSTTQGRITGVASASYSAYYRWVANGV